MRTEPLSLTEARRYGALATAVAVTGSAGIGAGTALTAGPVAGVAAAVAAAAVAGYAALATLRVLVTCPR